MSRAMIFGVALMGLALAPTGGAQAAERTLLVTSADDGGAGSLRAALEHPTPGSRRISILPGVGPILARSPLTYSGDGPLTIIGLGQRKEIRADFAIGNLFTVDGGADLRLINLAFADAPESNIVVGIPSDRTGTVGVRLIGLAVQGSVGGDGLTVRDRSPLSSDGSPASISLAIRNSRFFDGGDQNVSVDEVGEGGVVVRGTSSMFTGARNDNVSLSEDGDGSLVVGVRGSRFNDARSDRGLDVLERGSGDLKLTAISSEFNHNNIEGGADEGLKAVESDEGSFEASLVVVTANGNQGEGLDLDELGLGNISAILRHVTTNRNGGGVDSSGVNISEFGGGKVKVRALLVRSRDNPLDGLSINGSDHIKVEVLRSALTDNDAFGIDVSRRTASGRLRALFTDLSGNGAGGIDSNVRTTAWP